MANDSYLPKDFWAYEHIVNNCYQLVSYLFGLDCLLARAWKQVVEHARLFQAEYKRFESNFLFYYVSVLEELNRRSQTFAHSGADKSISTLKSSQLDFITILDGIEHLNYYVRTRSWAQSNPCRKSDATRPSPISPW